MPRPFSSRQNVIERGQIIGPAQFMELDISIINQASVNGGNMPMFFGGSNLQKSAYFRLFNDFPFYPLNPTFIPNSGTTVIPEIILSMGDMVDRKSGATFGGNLIALRQLDIITFHEMIKDQPVIIKELKINMSKFDLTTRDPINIVLDSKIMTFEMDGQNIVTNYESFSTYWQPDTFRGDASKGFLIDNILTIPCDIVVDKNCGFGIVMPAIYDYRFDDTIEYHIMIKAFPFKY